MKSVVSFSFSKALAALLAVFMMMSFSPFSLAEQKRLSDEQRVEFLENLKAIQARLNLSTDQEQQMLSLLREGGEQRKSILRTYGVERDKKAIKDLSFFDKRALGKDMKRVREQTTEKAKGILTVDQFKEFQKIQQEQKDRMREKLHNRS